MKPKILKNNVFFKIGLDFWRTLQHFFYRCAKGAIHPQVRCYLEATLQHFFCIDVQKAQYIDKSGLILWQHYNMFFCRCAKGAIHPQVGCYFEATLQHFFVSMCKRRNQNYWKTIVFFRFSLISIAFPLVFFTFLLFFFRFPLILIRYS